MPKETYRVLGINSTGSVVFNESCSAEQTEAAHDRAMSTPGVVVAQTMGPFIYGRDDE